MQKIKIGLIRALTLEDPRLLEHHGKLIENNIPSLKVISKCIKNQPNGIYNEETEKLAIPKIIELGQKFVEEEENIKAIIISGAFDPGVKELRTMLNIPVIGAGSSVAALSLSYGKKVGTLGITEQAPSVMREILGKKLIAEMKVDSVKNTLDLMTAEGKENTLRAARHLEGKGAQIIALACTGFSTAGIVSDLEKEVRIPIIDAVVAAGFFTWYFVRRQI